MGCLYQLTSPSGKSYIGISSKSANERWRQHRYNAAKEIKHKRATECRALYSAMRKYGPDTFTIDVLLESDDWDELSRMERQMIAKLKTRSPMGYNLTDGGDGTLGATPSDVARQRMSKAQKRIMEDPEMMGKRLAWLQDAIVKAAEFHRAMTPAQRAEHGRAVSRGSSTPESKKKRKAIQEARWADPEERKKQSIALTGRKMPKWSEERKQAAAELRRKEWADPIMRAKRLAGYKQYQESRL
jgi:group I intron endonuclease